MIGPLPSLPSPSFKVVTMFDLFKFALDIASLRIDKLKAAKAAWNQAMSASGDRYYGEAAGLDTVLELLGVPDDSVLRPHKSLRDWRRPPWL